MTQLSYEPAFDPYHTIFRFLRLMLSLPSDESHRIEKVRILDFYLLFPYLIKKIRLKPEHRSLKKVASNYNDRRPYAMHPSAHVLFSRMEPIQKAALSTMAIEGYLDMPAYEENEFLFVSDEFSADLFNRCMKKNTDENDLMELIETLSTQYDLLGNNGLKARTGLMEYRNDPV